MSAAPRGLAENGSARQAPAGNLIDGLPDPWTPRKDIVPSKERPEGHWATPRGRTPLQQHLDYFDLNKDGYIYPWETFWALRYLKFAWEPFNSIIAFWVTVIFHAAFAWPSQGSWLPNPLFPIVTKNASNLVYHAGTETLDEHGYFLPAKFEAIWERYDRSGHGRLSLLDVIALIREKSNFRDPFGTLFTAFQWLLTWFLFRDDSSLLRKADVRGLYDGTAFYRLADRTGNPWYGMAARRDAVNKHHMG